MIRWRVDKGVNGYVVEFPRKGGDGFIKRETGLCETWGDVLTFLKMADGDSMPQMPLTGCFAGLFPEEGEET